MLCHGNAVEFHHFLRHERKGAILFLALIIQLNRDPKTYKRRVTHFWKNPAHYD